MTKKLNLSRFWYTTKELSGNVDSIYVLFIGN